MCRYWLTTGCSRTPLTKISNFSWRRSMQMINIQNSPLGNNTLSFIKPEIVSHNVWNILVLLLFTQLWNIVRFYISLRICVLWCQNTFILPQFPLQDHHYHQMVVLHLRILRVGWSDWWWCIKYDMNDHGISGCLREGYLDHISQAIGGSSHFCQYSLSPPQKIEKNKTISWCVRMSSWNVFLESPFPLKAWFV